MTLKDFDVISQVEVTTHRDLLGNDALRCAKELREGRRVLRDQCAVDGIAAHLHHLIDLMTQRLARNGCPMRAATTDFMSLDEQRAHAVFGSLHRGAFATGTTANDDEVVLRIYGWRDLALGVCHGSSQTVDRWFARVEDAVCRGEISRVGRRVLACCRRRRRSKCDRR